MLKTKWYEESPGVTSSKRLFGGMLLAMGVAMKLTVFILALIGTVGDPEVASAQGDAFMISGTSLLGITGLDVLKKAA